MAQAMSFYLVGFTERHENRKGEAIARTAAVWITRGFWGARKPHGYGGSRAECHTPCTTAAITNALFTEATSRLEF